MADARERHGAGGEIADDALREAFARLPGQQDLVRCAATCRRWRRLVTDRAFLRRVGLWPDTARHPCVLAGIFSQKSYPFYDVSRLFRKNRSLYTPPQFQSLQAGGTHLTFDSFIAHDDGLFDLARPLAARRGFLLVRVVLPPSPGDHRGYRRKLRLAVCRPYKRDTRLLPPPPFDMADDLDRSLTGCTVLTGADHADDGDLGHKQQPMFRVLLIYDDGNGFTRACTYSSDNGSWSAPVRCFRPSRLFRCGPLAGVVTRGTVHWLFMDVANMIYYTLNISAAATSHVSWTEIPTGVYATVPRTMIPCIAGEEAGLSFVTIQHHGVADLWTKQEQEDDHDQTCDEVWQCSKLTELGNEEMDVVFFAESRCALLVKQGGAFSIFDLKSKEKTSVHLKDKGTKPAVTGTCNFLESCSSTCCSGHFGSPCLDTPPVLYEMDWIFSHRVSSLTSSRLGDKIRVD